MNLGLLVTDARDTLHYPFLYASLSHISLKFLVPRKLGE